jgi:hypothetical protein
MAMIKVKHQRHFRLEWEGCHWTVNLSEWRDEKTGRGELRAYAVEGDITDPGLIEALDLEAQARGLAWRLNKHEGKGSAASST